MLAHDMAFTGTWDDRAAHDRGKTAALRADAAVLPLWRGKPQLDGHHLGWVGACDSMLRHAGDNWLYLGRHEGLPPITEQPGIQGVRAKMVTSRIQAAIDNMTSEEMLKNMASF